MRRLDWAGCARDAGFRTSTSFFVFETDGRAIMEAEERTLANVSSPSSAEKSAQIVKKNIWRRYNR
jgi:hypothetical protein